MNSILERIDNAKEELTGVGVERVLFVQGYIQSLKDTLDADIETEKE